jgi:hypothetical protein
MLSTNEQRLLLMCKESDVPIIALTVQCIRTSAGVERGCMQSVLCGHEWGKLHAGGALNSAGCTVAGCLVCSVSPSSGLLQQLPLPIMLLVLSISDCFFRRASY